MDFEIRPATDEDLDDVVRAVMAAYGEHAGDDTLADARTLYELDRTLAAFDHHGRPVGVAAAITFDLTVPGGGGSTLTGAGLVEVGVLPTHRRRGILTALMERHLDESRARGEAVSTLIASEGGIYGRFGFGAATFATAIEVDTRDAAFLGPATGDHRLLPPEEAAIVLPDLYEAYRRQQPGEVSRSDRYWDVELRRADDLFIVADVDGYATYRVREAWPHGQPAFECEVEELVALTPAARAALWRYLLDLDLVRVVRAGNTPPGEPLRWLLADPRAMRTTRVRDMLWLRLVDVPAALSARRYAVDERLVIEVQGEGRYALDAGECRPAPSQAPDLSITVADLGAAYLGGVGVATLARAGRVVEHTRGTLARADTLFRSDPPPHTVTDF